MQQRTFLTFKTPSPMLTELPFGPLLPPPCWDEVAAHVDTVEHLLAETSSDDHAPIDPKLAP